MHLNHDLEDNEILAWSHIVIINIVVAVRLRRFRILENLKLAMPYDDVSYIFFWKPFHQGAHKQIMLKERKQETTKKQYIQIRKKIKIGKRERER